MRSEEAKKATGRGRPREVSGKSSGGLQKKKDLSISIKSQNKRIENRVLKERKSRIRKVIHRAIV